jgi:hypothetical protein
MGFEILYKKIGSCISQTKFLKIPCTMEIEDHLIDYKNLFQFMISQSGSKKFKLEWHPKKKKKLEIYVYMKEELEGVSKGFLFWILQFESIHYFQQWALMPLKNKIHHFGW